MVVVLVAKEVVVVIVMVLDVMALDVVVVGLAPACFAVRGRLASDPAFFELSIPEQRRDGDGKKKKGKAMESINDDNT